MSLRSAFAPPLRRCLKDSVSTRLVTRCLHSPPRRPLQRSLPTHHHPLLQRRAFARDSTGTFWGNARILFRQYPYSMTLALTCILIGSSSIIYVNYYYQTYIIGAYHNFPEDVAKKLRRAIYYSTTDLNPQEAVKYYRQALQVADEIGMDPFSDEIMGVKIHVAALMEKCEQIPKAIEVLERIRNDNFRWLDKFREDERENMKDGHLRRKRTRILAKTVALSVKLGEHYASGVVWDRDMAVERMTWAVETVEKEKRRRRAAGATDESDGPWMTDEEQGAAMEALAHGYEAKNMHYLATPLFLHALNLKEEKRDCHSVILMNNLASSLAQQSPRAARAVQAYAESANIKDAGSPPAGPVATRESLIENAQLWARKALDVARTIKPPDRTEECDVGCAVATHNLAEFAEMLGNETMARKGYEEAVSLSRAIGFQDGVEMSSERLRKLKGID